MPRRTYPKQPRLPGGRYRTRLVGRETTTDGVSARKCTTLAFEVVVGDYAGTVIRERLWSPILLARAEALGRGQLVDILTRTPQYWRHSRKAN